MDREPTQEQTIDDKVAFLTLSLMEDVVDRGTAASIRRRGFGCPLPEKPAPPTMRRMSWFVGMTPDIVAGVWLGFDQPKTITTNATGGSFAAPVWAD